MGTTLSSHACDTGIRTLQAPCLEDKGKKVEGSAAIARYGACRAAARTTTRASSSRPRGVSVYLCLCAGGRRGQARMLRGLSQEEWEAALRASTPQNTRTHACSRHSTLQTTHVHACTHKSLTQTRKNARMLNRPVATEGGASDLYPVQAEFVKRQVDNTLKQVGSFTEWAT